jgi:hypothetical protein
MARRAAGMCIAAAITAHIACAVLFGLAGKPAAEPPAGSGCATAFTRVHAGIEATCGTVHSGDSSTCTEHYPTVHFAPWLVCSLPGMALPLLL